MTTFPIAFPVKPGIQEAEMVLVRKTNISQSPFGGKEQRFENPFHLWAIRGKIPIIAGDEVAARDWKAFILELRGQSGTFNLPVPGITGPSTNYSGAQGLVKGVDLLGASIPTDGWTPSTPLLNRGDFFMIGGELKMCMVDVISSIIGEAIIVFEPGIISSPADNSDVVLNNPFVTMRMTTDTLKWGLRSPFIHSFNFEAIEVF